ncbi:E3 ubiquitin-protein ligase RNF146 isoform 3-T10 [Cyanocitta cristata]
MTAIGKVISSCPDVDSRAFRYTPPPLPSRGGRCQTGFRGHLASSQGQPATRRHDLGRGSEGAGRGPQPRGGALPSAWQGLPQGTRRALPHPPGAARAAATPPRDRAGTARRPHARGPAPAASWARPGPAPAAVASQWRVRPSRPARDVGASRGPGGGAGGSGRWRRAERGRAERGWAEPSRAERPGGCCLWTVGYLKIDSEASLKMQYQKLQCVIVLKTW